MSKRTDGTTLWIAEFQEHDGTWYPITDPLPWSQMWPQLDKWRTLNPNIETRARDAERNVTARRSR